MNNYNENIVDISTSVKDGKYKISFNKTNLIEGNATYVFDILVYETDERYSVEIGPLDKYFVENHEMKLCNNIPLGLDKKEVYLGMAKANSRILPFIPLEYRNFVEEKLQINALMETVIKQDEKLENLSQEELDIRSHIRALEAQRAAVTDNVHETTKTMGGK